MVSNFLSFMLSILQDCFSSRVFIMPLGFITVAICFSLFRKMGGRV